MQLNLKTLRHETFVHFGINLLSLGDKAALLADFIAGKGNKAIVERVIPVSSRTSVRTSFLRTFSRTPSF